jgi:phosphatidylglycerol:prolipoprotein diacylglycerol transferase
MATDLAAVISLSISWFYCQRFPAFPFWSFVAEFFVMTALYKIYLWMKAKAFGVRSRSFLQDTVLFLLPVYAGLNWILGYPLTEAMDLTGLMFPVYAGIVRIGCFFGGCCYGIPSRIGILYPDSIFESQTGCRSFSPGSNPGQRVFPVQLAEAMGNGVLFLFLWFWALSEQKPSGLVLPGYLLGYSVLRFCLDFFRRSSARPRIGKFSEAQIFCMATSLLSFAFIMFRIWGHLKGSQE